MTQYTNGEWLSYQDIPDFVLDELLKHYPAVSFDNLNKPVTPVCVSRALGICETIEEDTWTRSLDEKFEPKILNHIDKVRSFNVRGIFTDGLADIYQVGQIFGIKHRPETTTMTVEEWQNERPRIA